MLTKFLGKLMDDTLNISSPWFLFLHQYVLILWPKLIMKTVLVHDYGTHKAVSKSEHLELGK